MKKAISICLSMTLLLSCTRHSASHTDFKSYVESKEHGLRREVPAGDFVYEIQYKPAAYVALQETNGKIADTNAFRTRVKQLEHTIWFNIRIKGKNGDVNPLKKDVSGLEEYNSRLAYFLTEAGKNFSFTYGGAEMPQIGYFFENNYGLTPMDVMIVGFRIPDTQPVKDFKLIYNDDLFNNGIIKAAFSKEDIVNIPEIITEHK